MQLGNSGCITWALWSVTRKPGSSPTLDMRTIQSYAVSEQHTILHYPGMTALSS